MLTWLEINTKAILHNLKEFRRLAGPEVSIMPVIKANAYGHGFLGVANLCEKSREVDMVCVAGLDEAINLLENNFKKRILILSFFEQNAKQIRKAVKKNTAFPLYSKEQAKLLNSVGKIMGKKVSVHLKIDTGAARVGILPEQTEQMIDFLKKCKNLYLEGVWSHFASSEDDSVFTRGQFDIFEKATKKIEQMGIKIPMKHISCSAASALYNYAHGTSIRLGLGFYGLYPSPAVKPLLNLKPALSWHTSIIQVKTVSAGAKIGYGNTFTANRPTKIAILPVGYWDGYDRRFSNNASVLIKGNKCPVVGRICMNMMMVDASGVDARAGDRATLIGASGGCFISADDLAKWAGTINYEIVDRINPLLPRKYL